MAIGPATGVTAAAWKIGSGLKADPICPPSASIEKLPKKVWGVVEPVCGVVTEPVVMPVPANARTCSPAETLPTEIDPGDANPMLARAARLPAVTEVSERRPMVYSAPVAVVGLTIPADTAPTLIAPAVTANTELPAVSAPVVMPPVAARSIVPSALTVSVSIDVPATKSTSFAVTFPVVIDPAAVRSSRPANLRSPVRTEPAARKVPPNPELKLA